MMTSSKATYAAASFLTSPFPPLFPCVSACCPFRPCLGLTNCASHSVQQRGQRLKLSSLGGSSTRATLDRTGSPVRPESELSSPREVAEDFSKEESNGRESEQENAERSGGQDGENGQRGAKDQERSKGSVETEKEEDLATAKVKEQCCGGDDEENFEEGEESENKSERNQMDRSSFKMDGECCVEEQNEETSGNKESGDGGSREDKKEQTDSEEERLEIDAGKDCSHSNEDVERRSFSHGELKQRDEEGLAGYLQSEGGETEEKGSAIDEPSAALKPHTPQEGEPLFESGPARVHPAEADQKSDLELGDQRRESLAGSLVAEVRSSAVSVCARVPRLLGSQLLDLTLLISFLSDGLGKSALHSLPAALLPFNLFACTFNFLAR